MEAIITDKYAIHFNENCYAELNCYLTNNRFSKLFILVDENTQEHCLPHFLSLLETNVEIEIIEIDSGEEYKNIETCDGVWQELSELNADRKSLMINLGGGVVTDLGGFVAATFKRGIQFINVPTSLLAMVDASVGGKTGVDLGPLKNQIGAFAYSDMVLVDTHYLKTLSYEEVRSGFAEMLKHALIHDETYWNALINIESLSPNKTLDTLIYDSIKIKYNIVLEDPKENGIRKSLNYGHTLGHAIESYCLVSNNKEKLLHGEAIAIGLILETYLSKKLKAFPSNKLSRIKAYIDTLYNKAEFSYSDIDAIIELLKFDKKNAFGNVNFVLLSDIGKTEIDCLVDNTLIKEAFTYYAS
jgi:3-dehydroquinate synthase